MSESQLCSEMKYSENSLVLSLCLHFWRGQNISCRSKFFKFHFILLFPLALSFWLLHNAQHPWRVKITKLKYNIPTMPLGTLTEWECKNATSENPPWENRQRSPAHQHQLPVKFIHLPPRACCSLEKLLPLMKEFLEIQLFNALRWNTV